MKTSQAIVTCVALCGIALYAQGPAAGARFGGGPMGFGPHSAKVVTGAPFSADTSNSIVQHLQDGNTIQRSSTGKLARDSEGRGYQEHTFGGTLINENGPKSVIFITDPVAGFSYVLDPVKKIAFRRPFSEHKGWEGSHADGPRHNGGDRLSSPNVVKGDLGNDASSGVLATGKSVTRTIPAGTIGNSQPIVSTSETWYSPDLQIVVKTIHNDARFGQSTYALTNVIAKEPDANLFKVPAGYTIQDAPADHGAGFGHSTPPHFQ